MRLVYLLTFLLVLFFKNNSAQINQFHRADSVAYNISDENLKNMSTLSNYLHQQHFTDVEVARAGFIIAASKISYDEYCFKILHSRNKFVVAKQHPDSVLSRRMAICQGFSHLYKAICDSFNIKCFYISGLTKNYLFKSKIQAHAWNIVWVNNSWRIIDATWGEGFRIPILNFKSKKVNLNFFFAAPENIRKTHLPSFPYWQLTNSPYKVCDFLQDRLFNFNYQKKIDFEPDINYLDSIKKYLALDTFQQLSFEIKAMENANDCHDTVFNKLINYNKWKLNTMLINNFRPFADSLFEIKVLLTNLISNKNPKLIDHKKMKEYIKIASRLLIKKHDYVFMLNSYSDSTSSMVETMREEYSDEEKWYKNLIERNKIKLN